MSTSKSPREVLGWIRPEIRELQAYHVPPAAGLVKLDAMENPYTWPPQMQSAWLERLSQVSVNRYPDAGSSELIKQLQHTLAIPADAGVILGNGSDELIQVLAMAVAQTGRAIVAPDPTFVMYRMIATYTGMSYRAVPLRQDFSLDIGQMLAAIEETQPALVFLSYPNNPTGNLFDRADMEKIIKASPGLVVVDEAYHAFAGDSFLQAVGDFDNLLVMRTLSKIGLAGLRLGLLCGPPLLIDELDKIRLPYNIGVLTQVTTLFALQHYDSLLAQTREICEQRQEMLAALKVVPGVTAYDSAANFILFRVQSGHANQVFNGLKERGILIKNMHANGGLMQDCLRVTVGKADENQAFLAALGQVL